MLQRGGTLSGSTLKEAHSWGKVDKATEQMVFSEASVALPLIAGYAYGKGNWRDLLKAAALRYRQPHRLAQLFSKPQPKVVTA